MTATLDPMTTALAPDTLDVRDSASDIATRLAATTAALVCTAALAREESRGAHLRGDFPSTTTSLQARHVMQKQRSPL